MIKIFRFLAPWRWSIAILLALVFFQVLADLFLPTLMADIIDQGVMLGDTAFILRVGGIMLLITLLSIFFAVVASWISATVAAGFGQNLRSAVFTKVSEFSLHEFDQFGASTLITRATNDITQVQMVTIVIARMLLMAPMMAIGGIIMAYSQDPQLTWVLAVAVPVLLALIILIARKAIPLFSSIQIKLDQLNSNLREALSGVRVIRAFNRVDHEKQRFEDSSVDLSDTYIAVNRLMAFMIPGLMLIMNLTTLAVLWFGFDRIETGSLQLGSLIAFTQYAMQILFAFMLMAMMFSILPRAQAAAVRIDEVLQTEPGIVDPALPQTSSNPATIEFKSVNFRYPGAEVLALKNISFRAEPGKVTAIIGSTGAGKSTLVRMIPRFYDIESGQIEVGAIEIRDYSQFALRQRIAYVPQQVTLFSGSVKHNLLVANPDADDEQLNAAATTAQAMPFIEELDGALDHEIQQGGKNLSGGQKQRLAIARALSRPAEVFLFDDSFSALDFTTDARLRAALKEKVHSSTVIIVAQRVGTVMDADQILVMDEGEIVGRGTHSQLLEDCPTYQEIVASQLRAEDVA
ncbi:MAG: ATP-binding cassette domain-containing protein [Pseudomonadales bacterium]|nr:ATP-binding cassette domain-containing protein [Pseudomonadales bacterium]